MFGNKSHFTRLVKWGTGCNNTTGSHRVTQTISHKYTHKQHTQSITQLHLRNCDEQWMWTIAVLNQHLYSYFIGILLHSTIIYFPTYLCDVCYCCFYLRSNEKMLPLAVSGSEIDSEKWKAQKEREKTKRNTEWSSPVWISTHKVEGTEINIKIWEKKNNFYKTPTHKNKGKTQTKQTK